MDFVVDANIVFATLIQEGKNYKLLFRKEFHLFTPDYIIAEIEKHREEILTKTKRSPAEFEQVLEILKRRITLIPMEKLIPFVEQAETLTPDPDDMAYFALALKLNCSLWSNDKVLKQQSRIKVYNTNEVALL